MKTHPEMAESLYISVAADRFLNDEGEEFGPGGRGKSQGTLTEQNADIFVPDILSDHVQA